MSSNFIKKKYLDLKDAIMNYLILNVNTNKKRGKGGEFKQILRKKKKNYLLSKGYTCRFKSEAFASFASIALRPCHVYVLLRTKDYIYNSCYLTHLKQAIITKQKL
jgi:hypothetical protein